MPSAELTVARVTSKHHARDLVSASLVHRKLSGVSTVGRTALAAAAPDSDGSGMETAHRPWHRTLAVRFAWTIVSVFTVESILVGLSALPAVAFFEWHAALDLSPRWLEIVIIAMSLIPAYAIFSVVLMAASAWTMRLLGWRPPERAELPIADLAPELCNWGRYMISSYIVRMLVGPFTQATFVWTWYMRMNGAKIGRRVWVNSLGVTDHCNLTFGDDVVVGAGVHMSAHTVERGVVRIAPVSVGAQSTIGVGTHVQIGVEIGANCQIGSMSVIPKFTQLERPGSYAGIPISLIERTGTTR